VFRRYSLFDELRERLEEVYRSKRKDPGDLPPLPGKKFLGRSHVRKVAEERVAGINAFLAAICAAPVVCRCTVLLDFLALGVDDVGDEEEVALQYSDDDNEDEVFLSSAPAAAPGDEDTRPRCVVKLEYCGDAGTALSPGDAIFLRRRIGNDWYEGEFDGQLVKVPKEYVNVVVDLPAPSDNGRRAPPSSAPPKRRAPSSAPPKRSTSGSDVKSRSSADKLLSPTSKTAPPRPKAPPSSNSQQPPRPLAPTVRSPPGGAANAPALLAGEAAAKAKKPRSPSAPAKTASESPPGKGKQPTLFGRSSLPGMQAGAQGAPATGGTFGVVLKRVSDGGGPSSTRKPVASSVASTSSPPPPLASSKPRTSAPGTKPAVSTTKPRSVSLGGPLGSANNANLRAKPSPSTKPALATKPKLATKPQLPKKMSVLQLSASEGADSKAIQFQRTGTVATPTLRCHCDGKTFEKEFPGFQMSLIAQPKLSQIMPMVERLVTKSDIVLNYRDAADSGLVAIGDEDDLELYVAERPAALALLLELEVTTAGDFSVYRIQHTA